MKQFGWKHLIWSLAVGVAAGVALGLHLPRWSLLRPHRGGDPTAHMVDRFSRDLKLTAEQRTKLTAILEKTHKRLMSLRKEAGPKFEAIRKETSRAIEKILTPEQAKRFHEMEKKRAAHHRGPGSRAGGPGPGPEPGPEAPGG
jgi:Spy/CpxP family protein refolding chaperone